MTCRAEVVKSGQLANGGTGVFIPKSMQEAMAAEQKASQQDNSNNSSGGSGGIADGTGADGGAGKDEEHGHPAGNTLEGLNK